VSFPNAGPAARPNVRASRRRRSGNGTGQGTSERARAPTAPRWLVAAARRPVDLFTALVFFGIFLGGAAQHFLFARRYESAFSYAVAAVALLGLVEVPPEPVPPELRLRGHSGTLAQASSDLGSDRCTSSVRSWTSSHNAQ
jgi:hypothetical protein